MTPDALKRQSWRWGSVALFAGLPVLLLAAIAAHVAQIAQADDVAAREDALAHQIVAKLSTHPRRDLTPSEKAALYLGARTPTLAAAEIQDRATKLVAAAGGRLVEAQLDQAPEDETSGRASVRLTLDIDNKGLLDLVYAIETGLPLMTVTDLDVATPSDTAAPAPQTALRVGLTVRARFRRDG